jgi:2-polyprenyl-3-methyl-5-hydroxy-6-metoxy-1,4-benzoquinol methylase
MAFLNRLRQRERIAERMDDPAILPVDHRRALAALARINRITNSAGVLWPSIREMARRLARPIRLLDVATGSGDVPAALADRARQEGVALEIAGCDSSQFAIDEARAAHGGIEFFVHDAIRHRLSLGYDVVTSSLFLHHLSAEEAGTFLANLKHAARHLVLVNDLARSRSGFVGVWLATRFLTRSPVVHFDGPASVRSALTRAEAVELAERAGLTSATAQRSFPARFLLSWERK